MTAPPTGFAVLSTTATAANEMLLWRSEGCETPTAWDIVGRAAGCTSLLRWVLVPRSEPDDRLTRRSV